LFLHRDRSVKAGAAAVARNSAACSEVLITHDASFMALNRSDSKLLLIIVICQPPSAQFFSDFSGLLTKPLLRTRRFLVTDI